MTLKEMRAKWTGWEIRAVKQPFYVRQWSAIAQRPTDMGVITHETSSYPSRAKALARLDEFMTIEHGAANSRGCVMTMARPWSVGRLANAIRQRECARCGMSEGVVGALHWRACEDCQNAGVATGVCLLVPPRPHVEYMADSERVICHDYNKVEPDKEAAP